MLWQCQSMKNPEETHVKQRGSDLEQQFVGALGQGGAMDRPVDAVDPQGVHVADGPVVDPLESPRGPGSAAT